MIGGGGEGGVGRGTKKTNSIVKERTPRREYPALSKPWQNVTLQRRAKPE